MKALNHTAVLPLLLLAAASVACTSSELEVPVNHPGHSDAAAGRLPRMAALDDGFGEATPSATPSATAYTCPMHPEITRSEPGSCPICGMTLVPKKEAK